MLHMRFRDHIIQSARKVKRSVSISHIRLNQHAFYRICDMCYIKNVGLRAVGQVYCNKRHNYSEPAHKELFNLQFNHYLHGSIGFVQVWVYFNGECM